MMEVPGATWQAQTPPDAASKLFRLDGRIALVTGASRGLGLEMAAVLGSAGAMVLVNSRDEAKAVRIAEQFVSAGLNAEALPFDPADDDMVASALSKVSSKYGRIDILICNAAARLRAGFADIAPANFRDLLNINLSAVYALCWQAMPLLKGGSQGGRIILISSVSARAAPVGDVAYSVAKAGVESLVRAIAVECGRDGVVCNAIAPGPFRTEVNQKVAAESGDAIAAKVPLGRFGEPHELAGVALFLASDAASFLTGQTIVVDGGMTAML
jgi:gluconate 5-dehydrogenase